MTVKALRLNINLCSFHDYVTESRDRMTVKALRPELEVDFAEVLAARGTVPGPNDRQGIETSHGTERFNGRGNRSPGTE